MGERSLRFQNSKNKIVFTIRMKAIMLERFKSFADKFVCIFKIIYVQKILYCLKFFDKLLLSFKSIVFCCFINSRCSLVKEYCFSNRLSSVFAFSPVKSCIKSWYKLWHTMIAVRQVSKKKRFKYFLNNGLKDKKFEKMLKK